MITFRECCADAALRLAWGTPEASLHRGTVPSLSPGWRDAALPLTAANDDETVPFPVPTRLGGSFVDEAVPTTPLVLYRLLGVGGGGAAASLRVTKRPATGALQIAY